jgi:glycosyltransferase involved in cell wall biosynthesis
MRIAGRRDKLWPTVSTRDQGLVSIEQEHSQTASEIGVPWQAGRAETRAYLEAIMTAHADLSIVAIIPLFNGAQWIEQAITSVLLQTRQPDEFIVVDDGSTDNGAGAAIVERMAQDHPIIELLRKPNGGQSSARNFGARYSKSALIALLDQDDIWYPMHLERLVQPFRQKRSVRLGWVYSNFDTADESGRLLVRNYLRDLSVEHPKRHLVRALSENMHVLPGASLISRAAFETIGGFDERLSGYEDDDIFLRLFVANYDNIFIDEPLSQWRMVHSSSGHSFRMLASGMIYMDKLLKEYPDNEACNYYYARDFIAPRFLKTAFAYYARSLRYRDADKRREVTEDIKRILPHLRRRWKIPLRLILPLMRSWMGAWILMAVKPLLVRVYRAALY